MCDVKDHTDQSGNSIYSQSLTDNNDKVMITMTNENFIYNA